MAKLPLSAQLIKPNIRFHSTTNSAWQVLSSVVCFCFEKPSWRNLHVTQIRATSNYFKKVDTLSTFFLFPASNTLLKHNEQYNTVPFKPPFPPFNVNACLVECHCEFRTTLIREEGVQVTVASVYNVPNNRKCINSFFNCL